MGKFGLAFHCFFRVFRDPEFVKVMESMRAPSLPKPLYSLESPKKPEEALQLLAYLQEEGRLLDFLQEDLSGLEDEQIGAAVRSIHQNCKKAIHKLFQVVPVVEGIEGSEITVPSGFDTGSIKLVGNVHGLPPFRGNIRHHGWKVVQSHFPPKTE
ncbi:MAG: DUF2760 domain-containing protein, partial [Planctomycetota bacterium]